MLTTEQKEKILKARGIVLELQNNCDNVFLQLVKELELSGYLKQVETDLSSSPVDYLFDIVFNTDEDTELEAFFERFERSINEK